MHTNLRQQEYTRAAQVMIRTAPPLTGNGNSAATQTSEGSGSYPVDVYSPQDGAVWKPVNRAQFAQVVFGGQSQADQLRAVGELVRKRGQGGHLRKAELQKISPQIFGDLRTAPQLLTLPDLVATFQSKSPQSLLYSNNPERIKTANLRLTETDLPAGKTRLMSHHLNDSEETLRMSTIFRNTGDKNVQLIFEKKASTVGREDNAGRDGIEVYGDYLREQRTSSHQIEPGGAYIWDQDSMIKGEAISSLALISSDGPLKVTNAITRPEEDPLNVELQDAKLETKGKVETTRELALKYRGSGLYKNPDQHRMAVVPVDQHKVFQIVLGPEEEEGRSTYDGEYGQERHISLYIGDKAKPKQRLAILAWAGADDPAGVRTVGETSELLEIVGKPDSKLMNQVGVLFEGEVKPGQVLKLDQMVQGGASTPIRFLIIPIPPAEDSVSRKQRI